MKASWLCLLVVTAIALGCGDKKPPPPAPKAPPRPGLTRAEAERLPRCLDALEHTAKHPAGIAWLATACSPECELNVPISIAKDYRSMLAFIVGRCAADAERGESMWHLAKLTGEWIASIYARAPNSHPALADRLVELVDNTSLRLQLESKVPSMYHLPIAAVFGQPQTEVYSVVTGKWVTAGIAQWVRFSEEGAQRTIGFGGAFPGKRVKLKKLREVATRLHATVSDDPEATAEDRAPLLLADRGLGLSRLRRVVRELGRARLGVDSRGLVGEHPVHLNWVDTWDGTWLLYRPSRTLVRIQASERRGSKAAAIVVPHKNGEIDWPGVRAALARAGGGDLALAPPGKMTVRELTVVLDQIRTPDSDPSLFFAPRPGLEPEVKLASVESSKTLDTRIVKRYLERKLERLVDCYKPVVATDEAAEGEVRVRFTVDGGGHVTELDVGDGLGGELAGCVKAGVGAIRFPRPVRRQPANVTAVLSFTAG